MVYMSRFFGRLLVDFFLNKAKDMNDRGIGQTFPLCARIFEFFSENARFQKICRSGLHVNHYGRGFWLFTG